MFGDYEELEDRAPVSLYDKSAITSYLQHHAAHLSLRLRLDAHLEIPWMRSGWRDV